MQHSARAAGLLHALADSHARLLEQAGAAADAAVRDALGAVYTVFAAGFSDLDDEQISRPPSAEEWSIADVAEHVAAHDRTFVELEEIGIGHYIEHGLEHALQLWRLRATALGNPASG